MRSHPFTLVVLLTIVAMAFSAFSPASVRADDFTPPPPETGSEATPEPAVEAEQVPVEATEAPVTPEVTSDEVISDGVDVVITDEQGESVPLTSPEGVDALLNGQPVWCPDGVTPDLGEGSCTASFGSISDLLTAVGDEQEDGAIYIQTEVAEVVAVADMPSADLATEMLEESNAAGLGAVFGITLQDTSVVVLDEQGDVVPAMSEGAVDALLDGTSIWCPEGLTPETGGDACTQAVDSLGLMTSMLGVNPPQEEGTVFVQAVVDPSAVPVEDASLLEAGTELTVEPTMNSEVVDVLAQGIDVAVVDEQGQELSLVDETILETGVIQDPVWCPDGVTPTPGSNGCTISYASLGQLVSFLTTNQPTQNGTIWIEQGADASVSSIVINGSTATTWANYALTLQGGWSGASGNSSITGQTTFSQSISVINWLNDVTLNDLTVQNTSSTGIYVNTQGDIVLEDVSSNSNAWDGAVLINSGTSSVSVIGTNSFNGNGTNGGGDGLFIFTNGDIELNNITANNNMEDPGSSMYGAGVNAETTNGSIAVTGQNTFNNNQSINAAFSVDSGSGNILLENLTASNGTSIGVGVYNGGSGSVSIFGSNTFTDLYGDGIIVYSYGDIYAENISTNNTGGIHLETHNGSVVLTGTSYFNNTIYQGHVLFIQVTNNVYVEGVTSTNGINGDGIKIGAGGDVTIVCSSSSNNSEYGLEVGFDDWVSGLPLYYPDTLTLNNVSFSNNAFGDYLVNGNGTTVYNNPGAPCAPSLAGEDTLATFMPSSPSHVSLNVINLTGPSLDAPLALDCTSNSGTMLVLPLGNFVSFDCPTTGNVNLFQLENINGILPGPLPDGSEFVSALSAVLLDAAGPRKLTEAPVTISFVIPADMLEANLAILYWDGTAWVDLSTTVFTDGKLVYNPGTKTGDGRFEASMNFVGVFVLVKK